MKVYFHIAECCIFSANLEIIFEITSFFGKNRLLCPHFRLLLHSKYKEYSYRLWTFQNSIRFTKRTR